MIRPDLHMHTAASDGVLPVHELARQVQRADVTLFSVTDHDTVASLPAAFDAAYERGLAFIPGVEISTEGDEDIHILGYGVDPEDEALLSFLRQSDAMRLERTRRAVDVLSRMGMPLDWDELSGGAEGTVGRLHIARALTAKGYVQNESEAFSKYLGKGRPACVPRETPAASKAISLLRSRGAVPVLAHPGLIHWPRERLLPMLRQWMDAGLMGIEVYHPANRLHYPLWDRIARQNGLLVTGGSDFHDFQGSHGRIGETAAEWPDACDDAWKLYRAAKMCHF
ncbi:MAG: PHP domain-containing protein [Clostridia bacterium]|nr:PHP domain-containing protein [Clostridia bacterium]